MQLYSHELAEFLLLVGIGNDSDLLRGRIVHAREELRGTALVSVAVIEDHLDQGLTDVERQLTVAIIPAIGPNGVEQERPAADRDLSHEDVCPRPRPEPSRSR